MYFQPLNFIRFILAAGVILFHYGVNYYPFNLPVLKTLILNSSFRVSFFFFISGFVMTLVYAKKGLDMKAIYFYKRRFSRLFPVYWLAFILTLLLLLFVGNASPKGLTIILHFFGLQSLNPGYVLDLNFTTWSISVELIFYLLFPFALKWMLKQTDKKLLTIAVFVWLLQSAQHIVMIEVMPYNKITEEFISTFPLWHLSTFFTGMVMARFILKDALPVFFTKNSLVFFLLSLAVFCYVIFIPNPVLKYVHNGLLSPVFAVLIASLFYDRSPVSKVLSLKPPSALGTISYGLFIFQYPLWMICKKLSSETFSQTPLFFCIYFICLVSFAFIINRIFEKPMLRLLRKDDIENTEVVIVHENS